MKMLEDSKKGIKHEDSEEANEVSQTNLQDEDEDDNIVLMTAKEEKE